MMKIFGVMVLCTLGTTAGQTCIHDKLMKSKPKKLNLRKARSAKTEQTGVFEAIRVTIIMNTSYSCTENHQGGLPCWCSTVGETAPTFGEGTVSCTQDNLVDTTKLNYFRLILQESAAWIEKAFKVERVPNTLQLGAGTCGPGTPDAHGATVPTSHIDVGIPSTDILIYGTAVPVSGSTKAWALNCFIDTDNGRPVAGIVNFNPKLFTVAAVGSSLHSTNVQTTIHEIFHVLGFSNSNFRAGTSWFNGADPIGANGEITTPEVVKKTRAHFACQNLTGGGIEQQLGPGTAGSHWEKRIFGNEAMTGQVTSWAFMPVSDVTLALFKDTGVYDVNYGVADPLHWGKGKGCRFADASDPTSCGADKSWPEFCWNDSEGAPPTPDTVNNGWCLSSGTTPCFSSKCSFTLDGIGICDVNTYSSDLEQKFRHFGNPRIGGGGEIYDFCPIVSPYSNVGRSHGPCSDDLDNPCVTAATETECTDVSNGYCIWSGGSCVNALLVVYGNTYGSSARCFPTTNLIQEAYPHTAREESRCFKVVCTSAAYTIEVSTAGVVSCPFAGGVITVTGYSGTISCWPHDVVCTGRGRVAPSLIETAAPPTSVTAVPGGSLSPETVSPPSPPVTPPPPVPVDVALPPTSCSEMMIGNQAVCLRQMTAAACTAQSCTWCSLGTFFNACLFTGEACGAIQVGTAQLDFAVGDQCPTAVYASSPSHTLYPCFVSVAVSLLLVILHGS